MLWILCLALVTADQGPALPGAIDATQLQFSAPALVTEIDTGTLKGEPRQLAWSPDGDLLYLQTADGKPPSEKLRHYTVSLADGGIETVQGPPAWAVAYWTVKQDRVAPGAPWLEIAVGRRQETTKAGPGQAGVLDRQSNPAAVAMAGPSIESLANGMHGNQTANVLVLSLQGEEVTRWINEPRPIPGTRFSWGPSGSGALVGVGEGGRLVLLDASKHHRSIDGPKDALLPAWSTDGARLAYLQRSGRKKFNVMWLRVEKR